MARRAFLSALFGLFTAPGGLIFRPLGVLAGLLFLAYSGWTLLKLMSYSGELSPVGLRRLYAAFALDLLIVLLIVFLVARSLVFPWV
jgi:hypothetical protein